MIEFFEFLNTCSSLRTITYLIFITLVLFIGFAGIGDIIKRLRGDVNNHFYYYNNEEVVEESQDESDENKDK